jgi:hypothetical protein
LKAGFERHSDTASFTKKVALRRNIHEERNVDMPKKDDANEVAWVGLALHDKKQEERKVRVDCVRARRGRGVPACEKRG